MKTVVIEKPVRDVNGLLRKLRDIKPPVGIVNVGADARRTYVYLEDYEEYDPTSHVAEWRDPAEFRVVPMNAPGPSGLPEAIANEDEAHVVLIEKISGETGAVVDGNEQILVRCHGVIEQRYLAKLENGATSVQIGPVRRAGEVTLTISDPRGQLGFAETKLKFVPEAVEPPVPAPAPSVDNGPEVDTAASEMLVSDVGQPIGSEQDGVPTTPEPAPPPKRKWFWQRVFGR